jgi:hypothetical protein
VNLVGFAVEYARKNGLSVVTADTIAKTAEGNEIIIRSHQSVSNPTTELLGFLPDIPKADTYVFAVREANAFSMFCEDPEVFFDCQSDAIGGIQRPNLVKGNHFQIGTSTGPPRSKTFERHWKTRPKLQRLLQTTP